MGISPKIKKPLSILLMFFIRESNAESLSIPSATIPSGYDRITTSDGTTCESTIASDTYIQTGFMGVNVAERANKALDLSTYDRDKNKIGIYAQIVIPLGNKRKRIDCSRLYELEIRNLKQQLIKLQVESMSKDMWEEG